MVRIFPTCAFCFHEAAWLVPQSAENIVRWNLVCWTHLLAWRGTANRNSTFYFLDEEEDGFSGRGESDPTIRPQRSA